jgi:hypothetical protein
MKLLIFRDKIAVLAEGGTWNIETSKAKDYHSSSISRSTSSVYNPTRFHGFLVFWILSAAFVLTKFFLVVTVTHLGTYIVVPHLQILNWTGINLTPIVK